jgi:signal transduction histidine kinase
VLETARQSVKQSAIREGERLSDSINALEANLLTASTATVWQGSPQASQEFLSQLQQKLPTNIECIQLTKVASQKISASTCGNQPLVTVPEKFWSPKQESTFLRDQRIHVVTMIPPLASKVSPAKTTAKATSSPEKLRQVSQIHLIFSVPIYDRSGSLSQILHVKTSLLKEEPALLLETPATVTTTVILDQDGTILAHPNPSFVGTKIQEQPDADRLQSLLRNALKGKRDFMHLFAFQPQGQELLAGYTAIYSPVTSASLRQNSSTTQTQWIVLSMLPMESALAGLSAIQQILLVFTLALLMAGIFAAMYIATVLARPIEQMRDYALHSQPESLQLSQNFQGFEIKEFGQLFQALQSMVERLTTWAGEREAAWREATEANRLKSEFLANTSHELRTPLNAIIGCLRLVQDGFCDDRAEELDMIEKADQAAVHLLEIIDDLLDFAKIESGKLEVEVVALELNQLLREVIQSQSLALETKGLTLIPPDSSYIVTVEGDREKLRQVFLNLLSNAIKFTEHGSITISLTPELKPTKSSPPESLESPSPNNRRENIVVQFQDTGVGIPLGDQSKLFRPFVMADGSSTRKFGGTGLGLAISRNLVEMMGGTIRLFSQGEGCGTTVQVILPILLAETIGYTPK